MATAKKQDQTSTGVGEGSLSRKPRAAFFHGCDSPFEGLVRKGGPGEQDLKKDQHDKHVFMMKSCMVPTQLKKMFKYALLFGLEGSVGMKS